MFKNIPFLFITLLITTFSLAQNKEKIKGSKIVTLSIKELNSFQNIEVGDKFELFLVKGDKPSLEIEADDNLHDIINYEVVGNTLKINTLKEASGFKKFAVRVNYSDSLKLITARNEATIKALADLELDDITIKNYDNSKSYLNVKSKYFTLVLDDKSKAEINVNAEESNLELSKNSHIKALIVAHEVKIDMYQKSEATIEGNTTNAKIRLDNTSNLIAHKFVVKNLELTAESYSKCELNASQEISIEASGKSEIKLYGEPKISIQKFTNNTTLYKIEKH